MSDSPEILQLAAAFLRSATGPSSPYSAGTLMGAPDLSTRVLQWGAAQSLQLHQVVALLEYLQRTYTTAPADARDYLLEFYPPPKQARVCILTQGRGKYWIKWLDSPDARETIYVNVSVETAHSLIRYHGYTLVPTHKSTLPLS